jgi:hypothetical protein
MAFRTYSKPVLTEPARAGADIDSYDAENAVSQGQVVKQGSNEDQVTPSDTDGEKVIGVALYDASSGDIVDVVREANGVRLTSGSGSISADDALASHGGSGENGEVDSAAAGDYILGTAKRADEGSNDDVIASLNPQPGSDL